MSKSRMSASAWAASKRARSSATSGCTRASSRASRPGSAATAVRSRSRSTAAGNDRLGRQRRHRRDPAASRRRRGDAPRRRRPTPAPRPRRRAPAVVDFPMPTEPVSPSRYGLILASDRGAKLGVDLRPPSEPALEARNPLVQQHPEPVDGGQAERARRGDEGRRRRPVDDVGDQRAAARAGEVDRHRVASHADRGGVDDRRRARGARRRLGPGTTRVRRPEMRRAAPSARSGLRLAMRTSGAPSASSAAITARAEPPDAEHQRRPRRPLPTRRAWRRFSMKPKPSVLSAWIAAVGPEGQRVRRPDRAGRGPSPRSPAPAPPPCAGW